VIDEFGPDKVANCKELKWYTNPDHCQWIVAFGCATSVYLHTKEGTALTWCKVILGKEKCIASLIGRHTVRIVHVFDKRHSIILYNPTSRKDLRGSNRDVVEAVNNPN
jgi:hypothetical protein